MSYNFKLKIEDCLYFHEILDELLRVYKDVTIRKDDIYYFISLGDEWNKRDITLWIGDV